MEATKLNSTVKGLRTRFNNKPNVELEKKMVSNLCEKHGKLELLASVEPELKEYLRGVLGIVKVEAPTESPKENLKLNAKEETLGEVAPSKDGVLYKIDTVKKTCQRIFKDLSDIKVEDLDIAKMSMTTYQRYLRDNFQEDCPIKKGKLYFRGYRLSCDIENGFMIEDTTKKYAVVETEWEGIPTPKELGEFFKRPRVEHTPEELHKAVERGKELAAKKEAIEEVKAEIVEIDYELLRKKVLSRIHMIKTKKDTDFDPINFVDMIPFKQWKRKVNALLKEWKSRKIRYAKFLDNLDNITREQVFEVVEKSHRTKFVGTCLPQFKFIGDLVGDKINVDGKMIPAVPFIQEYLLHYEPKAMQQLMRYADGEIDAVTLLKNPYHKDHKIEYNSKKLKSDKDTAQLLTAFCASCGIVAPQDLLYISDLKVGDKILLFDGETWVKKTVTNLDNGVELTKGVGLQKLDKWIKLDEKEK